MSDTVKTSAGEDDATESEKATPRKTESQRRAPIVQQIKFNDILGVLDMGLRDFMAAPIYSGFFGLFYATAGWFLVSMFYVLKLNYYVYPMVTGFAMVAPFVAAGLYDISRRLELDLPLSWGSVLGSLKQARGRDLGWMVLVTTFSYIIWMDI